MIQQSNERIRHFLEVSDISELKSLLWNQVYRLPNSEMIKRALALVELYHRGEKRGANMAPYFFHPLHVCLLFIETGHQAEILGYISWTISNADAAEWMTVALLHDIVEDTAIELDELKSTFNPLISKRVEILSRKRDGEQILEKEQYFANLKSEYPLIKAIKVVDRIDNLLTYQRENNNSKKKDYIEETEKYILPLTESYVLNERYVEDNRILREKLQRSIDRLKATLDEKSSPNHHL